MLTTLHAEDTTAEVCRRDTLDTEVTYMTASLARNNDSLAV